ncbi:hypothetical protein AMELA_G00134640 [Ameiurus melas]|uniref:Ig-like domain-containing protein n=1 Tax=Ameiurus melas TaxID=219545 RepID=A0A7J6AN82_AMEME|nr:hypothetical protein AMELA_G00134640 [Ameiurus melas]
MSHTHWSDSEEISIHTSCWTMSKRTFFLLVVLGFCAMWQKADAQIILDKPLLSGPLISHVKSVEEFYCKLDKITTNKTILYQLFKKGNLNKVLSEYSAHSQEKAKFTLVITLAFDGWFICKASVQNNSEIIPTFSDWMKFKVLVPVKNAHIISSHSLEDLWENDSLTLRCNITEGNYVLYDWFLDDKLHLNNSNNQLIIPSLSSKNKGKYVCVAKNYFNETLYYTDKSEGRDVHVKEYLSQPEISFKIGKNKEGNFSAYVKCQVPKGSPPISYTLFRNNHHVAVVNSEHLNASFVVPIVLDQDMGTVYCQANDSKRQVESRKLNLTVEYLSQPEISFKIGKNEEGNFSAYVKCQVPKGSPPISYTLFRNNHHVAVVNSEHLNASFVVPIVLDQDMGTVYCQANDSKRQVESRKLNLTVESVGGNVTMSLEKAVGQDFDVYGVWLNCHVDKGTFPQYYWFLNNTRLDSQGKFNKTFSPNHSCLMVRLDPSIATAGFYHCEVFNSFDITKRLSSPRILITPEEFNKIPTEVAVIVFTLFSLLICAVLACCIYGVVLRKRQARKYIFRLKDFTDKHSIVDDDGVFNKIEETEDNEYEEGEHDDLDIDSYIEDTDVVQASMMEDIYEELWFTQ